jgi:hypothetical protein
MMMSAWTRGGRVARAFRLGRAVVRSLWLRRFARYVGIAPIAAVALAASVGAESATAALHRTVVLTAERPEAGHLTALQAIAYLNEQRAANGIPGDLVPEPALDEGCWDYTNLYQRAAGQFPHEEIPSQPGYTTAGDRAARSSDLAFYTSPEDWSSTVNPWNGAPLHLYSLFDPLSTTAWYGETQGKWGKGALCMGTSGPGEQPLASPGFFSVPGNGTTSAPTHEMASELPFTPGQAVGVPQGTETGPTIMLWATGINGRLESATLTGPGGVTVPAGVVTEETPGPPVPEGWPPYPTVGGNFVVPYKPLKHSSLYVVRALWADPQGVPYYQTATFTTATQAGESPPGPNIDSCSECAHGYLTGTVKGGHLLLTISPAAGERLSVTIDRGHLPAPHAGQILADAEARYTVHARQGTIRLRLPARHQRGDTKLFITVTVQPFMALGHRWGAQPALVLLNY